MKMNWGNKLVLVFIAFGSMIGYLVYRCSHTSFDLVSADYYKDELVYQQTIDAAQRAGALTGRMTVEHQNDQVLLRFPAEMKDASISGDAWFYCAADARRDKRVALHPGTGGVQELDRNSFMPGRYIAKISWSYNNRAYYTEQPLVIP